MLLMGHPQTVPQGRPCPLVRTIAAVHAAVPHKLRPLPPVGLRGGQVGEGRVGAEGGRAWSREGSGQRVPGGASAAPTEVGTCIVQAWWDLHAAQGSPRRVDWAEGARAAGCRRASGMWGARAPAAAWHSRPAALQLLRCAFVLDPVSLVLPLAAAASAAPPPAAAPAALLAAALVTVQCLLGRAAARLLLLLLSPAALQGAALLAAEHRR